VALLAGVTLLAGCAAPVAAPSDSGAGASSEPVEYAWRMEMTPEQIAYYTPGRFDGRELTVVINASWMRDGENSTIEVLRKKFEELSGAKVTYVALPENEMYDKVRLELANNSGLYDMMHTGAGGAKEYGLSNYLIPLPAPPDLDDFYPADIAQYSIGGELYGLPQTADTNILYWRTDLFEAAGLDPTKPPETYEQFREYAIKLTTDENGKHPGEDGFDPNNIDVYGSAFKGVAGLGSTWELYNYIYAFGGDVVDENYTPTLNSQPVVDALTWVVDNFRTYNIYPPDTPTYDYTEFHTLFAQGKVAMAVNWPYMWGILQDPEQSKVVGNVAVGRKPGQVTHGGNIGGWSWNVFQMSKDQELAIAFAKWIASPDASLSFAETGSNPVRRSVSAILAEQDPILAAAIAANQADGREVKWLATGPSWMEIEKVQYQAIQEALIGAKDPQTAMEDANAAVIDILNANAFFTELLPQLQGN
jgi:ABC-type glycerol-3-phosphate transport system substrate-binding protein